MRGDVVQDHVHGELVGNAAVDEVEEPPELQAAVSWGHLRDHPSRSGIEAHQVGRQQAGRATAGRCKACSQ